MVFLSLKTIKKITIIAFTSIFLPQCICELCCKFEDHGPDFWIYILTRLQMNICEFPVMPQNP